MDTTEVHIPSRAGRSALASATSHERTFRWLTRAMFLLLAGYLLFDRAFAWVHIPGTPIFVGEIALVLGLFFIIQTPHLGRLIRTSRPIQLLLLFMLWGFALAFEGVSNWGIDAIRDSVLWYYGFFALISSVMLVYKPSLWDEIIARFTRFIPVFLTVMIVRLAFSQASIGPRIPDSRARLVSHKSANIAVNITIAIAFLLIVVGPIVSRELSRRTTGFTLLGLLLVLGAGTQSRGGFLAALVVLGALFVLVRGARPVMTGVIVLAVLVAILAAALDVKFELSRRELSVEQVIENVQSISEEATSGTQFDNTTQWRLNLWGEVLEDVLREERVLTGFGFGENLAFRYEAENRDSSTPLRNPHNSHLSVIARMGIVGFGLWVAMFVTWYAQLFRARRQYLEIGEEQRASLSLWLVLAMTAILVNAFFDPTIEGPQVGVWAWTLFGMGAVLGLGARNVRGGRRRARRQPAGASDFDWLLLQDAPPVSEAHPALLSAELQEVVDEFDELIGEEPQNGREPDG